MESNLSMAMGYEIDTTWKRLHESDIKKLNKIIDDGHCNEMEISRKINIMKCFERSFNMAVDNFNFSSVIKFMKENDWTWYIDGEYAVPTKEQMIDDMRSCLKEGLFRIIERGDMEYIADSGGIIFTMEMRNGECDVKIYFDIANYYKDDINV